MEIRVSFHRGRFWCNFPPMDTVALMKMAAVFAGAYLAASVNFSIAASRVLGKGDLRSTGSGNPGATNLSRVAGKPAAAVVLLLDVGRAVGVVLAARLLVGDRVASIVAVPFLLGNLFPVFHRFRGGKGVAAAAGLMLAVSPVVMLCGGGVFLIALGIGRRVSAGSVLMLFSYPLWAWFFDRDVMEIGVCAAMATAVALTHRSNIARLFRGEEPPIFGAEKNGAAR